MLEAGVPAENILGWIVRSLLPVKATRIPPPLRWTDRRMAHARGTSQRHAGAIGPGAASFSLLDGCGRIAPLPILKGGSTRCCAGPDEQPTAVCPSSRARPPPDRPRDPDRHAPQPATIRSALSAERRPEGAFARLHARGTAHRDRDRGNPRVADAFRACRSPIAGEDRQDAKHDPQDRRRPPPDVRELSDPAGGRGGRRQRPPVSGAAHAPGEARSPPPGDARLLGRCHRHAVVLDAAGVSPLQDGQDRGAWGCRVPLHDPVAIGV